MVKLEEDEFFDDYEDFDEEKPAPQYAYDYKSRRILVWVEDKENQPQVEEALAFLLPLATIRIANGEEKAAELSEKEEWDTFVVDLTEENVSTSEFVKTANNNPEIMLVALNYSRLNRDGEQNEMYFEPIRKLFDLESFIGNQIED
jgi:CheY-like chemotaxis protein